jgi:hypothetical protein
MSGLCMYSGRVLNNMLAEVAAGKDKKTDVSQDTFKAPIMLSKCIDCLFTFFSFLLHFF